MKRLPQCIVMAMCALGILACAPVSQVKPWEKATLANPAMAPGGLGKDSGLFSHVYTSKEAAKGGEGVGGGGCGCN
jgi:hypothetical protein